MNIYTATFPLGADPRDIFATALAALPAPPDFPLTIESPNVLHALFITVILTPAQITTWQNAVAATVADPNAPWHKLDGATARLQNVVNGLNNQAAQLAALPPITSGNVVAVVQGIVNNLAVDLARLADIIVALQIGN